MTSSRKSSKPIAESAVIGRIAIAPKKINSPIRYIPRRSPSVTQYSPTKIQSAIMELFQKYDYQPIDMEALIFFAMQRFDVSVETYENLYRHIRRHILANFSATPGKHLLLQEVSMRRMLISAPSTE